MLGYKAPYQTLPLLTSFGNVTAGVLGVFGLGGSESIDLYHCLPKITNPYRLLLLDYNVSDHAPSRVWLTVWTLNG